MRARPTPVGRGRAGARPARRPGRCPSWRRSLPVAVGSVLAQPLVASTAAAARSTPPAWTAGPSPGPGRGGRRRPAAPGSTLDRLPDGARGHASPPAPRCPRAPTRCCGASAACSLDGVGGGRLYVGDPASGQTAPHPGYVEPGSDIRPRGQEAAAGEHLLEAGGVVTPAVAGMAAAAGYDHLAVVRPPDVAILVLGDELLERGSARDGRVRDALGPMLPGVGRLGRRPLLPARPRARHPRGPARRARRRQRRRRRHHRLHRGRPRRPPARRAAPARRPMGRRRRRRPPGHPMCLATLPGRSARDRRCPATRSPRSPPSSPCSCRWSPRCAARPAPTRRASSRRSSTPTSPSHPDDVRLVPVVRAARRPGGRTATPTTRDGPGDAARAHARRRHGRDPAGRRRARLGRAGAPAPMRRDAGLATVAP